MVAIERRLWTVEEYHRLIETGCLGEDEHVELIHGEIVRMAPMGSRHMATVTDTGEWFTRRTDASVIVRVQGPITMPDDSEPEPDIAIVRARADRYRSGHPRPGDVLLIIEVADTSLAYDRGGKGRLYARAGIIEYWLVDLIHSRIEVYRNPSRGKYAPKQTFRRGDVLSPLMLPHLSIRVEVIIGEEITG